jgi:hypothetical protein
MTEPDKAHLVMPLLRLAPPRPTAPVVREPVRESRAVPRLLHLDDAADVGLAAWAARVREAVEPCLLIDAQQRVVAMSASCGELLHRDADRTAGALLLDLLTPVDFSAAALALSDAELQVPPIRALRSGGLARGLVRLRNEGGTLSTYDVVGVPLGDGAGALAFLLEV